MNKITLTPEACINFVEKNKPAIITISNLGVTFNHPAELLLQLKKGFHFGLEIDDNELYYKDATTGFEIKSKLVATLSAPVRGLRLLLIDALKIEIPKDQTKQISLTYEVGEFKDGRRKLNRITKIK